MAPQVDATVLRSLILLHSQGGGLQKWGQDLVQPGQKDTDKGDQSSKEHRTLADDLNVIYYSFEKPTFTPFTHPGYTKQPPTLPACPSPLPTDPPPASCEEEVRQLFHRQKTRKAPSPDGMSPSCLKSVLTSWPPIFTQIFNRSLELWEVSSCFKRSTSPRSPTDVNALTSVVMKSFERLVLAHLKDITGPLLDPLQFAYWANRSVDDAVNIGPLSQKSSAPTC
ncbi:hypothetical protein N1851_033958 [Merluccius polli]|uniref:Uncharacterized protein n=1 Tax=Merluccius polli TaxID=89951 RepID=A0AA47NP14_MERPO|nr:hypothetical protein N1851_033958 [Merluccius polli]